MLPAHGPAHWDVTSHHHCWARLWPTPSKSISAFQPHARGGGGPWGHFAGESTQSPAIRPPLHLSGRGQSGSHSGMQSSAQTVTEAPLGTNVKAGRVSVTRGFSRHLGGLSPRRAWEVVTRCLPASPDTVPKETAPAALPARSLGVQASPCRLSFQQKPATQISVTQQSEAGDKAAVENGDSVEQESHGSFQAAKLDNSEADEAMRTVWAQVALLRRASGRKQGVADTRTVTQPQGR